MERLVAPSWGPPKLQDILERYAVAINARTPVSGLGIEVDEVNNGCQLNAKSDGKVNDPILDGPSSGGTGGTRAASTNIAFLLRDATITVDGEVTNKVLVLDGKVNGELPAGMGSDTYTLDLADPSDSLIWVGITFNPTTLAITSRFLQVTDSGTPPVTQITDDTNAEAYWLIGFTYFSAGTFSIKQTRLGDINFAFTWGTNNAKPALLPVDTGPGWINADVMF